MLVDSGADVTLLPNWAVDSLSIVIVPDKMYEVEAFDANTRLANVVQAELQLMGRTFRGLFLLMDRDHGVLGRNILNALRLFFDGPTQTWDELQRASEGR